MFSIYMDIMRSFTAHFLNFNLKITSSLSKFFWWNPKKIDFSSILWINWLFLDIMMIHVISEKSLDVLGG